MSESNTPVNITVNGQPVEAKPGELVIAAAEQAGVYIPHFCYHPRMNPVGMCRMCIVDIDTGRGPALQPSCMVSVSEGMVVDTTSEQTRKAQDGVLEFLLLNHPLDCPVCDKGGECPLQDQTMAYGPGESRFVEEKRHFEKPIPVNDLVYLDRERCILCDRCTRFADEVSGDPLITFQGRGDQTEVNTFPDQPFASYFSGNTVQICPVGALTARPYRFKARPWDLSEVESTYPNPMGDRVTVQASRDQVLRYQGVDSDAVNWGWLTDKDRFSFEAATSELRLHDPLVRGTPLGHSDPDGDELVKTSWRQALAQAAEAISSAIERKGPGAVAVLGGARLANEDQYVWARLIKGVIGTDHVDAQLDDGLPAEMVLGLPRATVADACTPGGTVILMAPDPKEELGTLYLRLRHAVINDGVQLIELVPRSTGLSHLAAHCLHHRPGEAAAVAAALVEGNSSSIAGGDIGGVPAESVMAAAEALADRSDAPITVIWGRASLAEDVGPTVDAAAELMKLAKLLSIGGRPGIRFLPALRRGNVFGALDMGLSPGLLPGRVTLADGGSSLAERWGLVPSADGLGAEGILRAAADGEVEVLILLGADPLSDVPNRDLAEAGMAGAATVIASDLFSTPSVAQADIVFPAAGFGERAGTHTNLEGRVTCQRQIVTSPGTARPDWVIAVELARLLGADFGFSSVEDVWAELVEAAPSHQGLDLAVINRTTDGQLVTATSISVDPLSPTQIMPIDAYGLRLVSSRRMYDRGTLVQNAPSMAKLAAPPTLDLHPVNLQRFGLSTGTTVRVVSPAGELTVSVSADSGVPRGSAALCFNHPDLDVRELIDQSQVVTDVRIET